MSWLSKLIVPAFPQYPGPYSVGTCDFEIPVSDLTKPLSSSPDGTENLPTVAFRIFYPCEKPTESIRPVKWIPSPQKPFIAAYNQLAGVGPILSTVISNIFRNFQYITIPAFRNGELKTPNGEDGRWPVMMFCHGLAGSRNAYSWITGSIASHGVVVIAIEHRDGSAPVSYVRSINDDPSQIIPTRRLPHVHTDEVFTGRDNQLKIRLWEIALIYDALAKINAGRGNEIRNLDPNSPSGSPADRYDVLPMFSGRLNLDPGKVSWAGHSFGGATMVQLAKSIYWQKTDLSFKDDESYKPLLELDESHPMSDQITPSSPVVLFDLWTLSLESPSTRWLWEKPMPSYLNPDLSKAGRDILFIQSKVFFDHTEISTSSRHVLSLRPADPEPSLGGFSGPYSFHVQKSVHLNQSDFGVLFSRLTTRMLKTQDPERILKLNCRAVCEFLRRCGTSISEPTMKDFTVRSSPAVLLASPIPMETILSESDRLDLDDWIPFEIELAPSPHGSDATAVEIKGENPTSVHLDI